MLRPVMSGGRSRPTLRVGATRFWVIHWGGTGGPLLVRGWGSQNPRSRGVVLVGVVRVVLQVTASSP